LVESRDGVVGYGFSQLGSLDPFLQRQVDTMLVVFVELP
jgi:hypothetical protein